MQTKEMLCTIFIAYFWSCACIPSNRAQFQHGQREVLLGFLYPFTGEQLVSEAPFASAFLVAVENINNSTLDLNLKFVWNDTQCSEKVGIDAMTRQWNLGVDVFIGPGNESICATSARVAAAWNLPIISYVSNFISFSPAEIETLTTFLITNFI